MKEKNFALFIFDLHILGYQNIEGGFVIDEEFINKLIQFNQITYEENLDKIKLLFEVEEQILEDEEIGYHVNFQITKENMIKISEILYSIKGNLSLSEFMNTFDSKELQDIADYTSDFYNFLIYQEEQELGYESSIGLYKYLKH